MAADAPTPCVTRPSATVALAMQDKQVLVFHGERFQLHVPSQCWEMIENANTFLYFLKFLQWIQHDKYYYWLLSLSLKVSSYLFWMVVSDGDSLPVK